MLRARRRARSHSTCTVGESVDHAGQPTSLASRVPGAVAPFSSSRRAKSRARSAFQEYILANTENTSKGLAGNGPFGIGPVRDFCLRLCCAATLFNVSGWRTWSRSSRAPVLHRSGSRWDGIPFRMATCSVSMFAKPAFPWSVNADRLWSSGLVRDLRPVSNPEHQCHRGWNCALVHGLLCVHWTRRLLDRRPAVRATYARIHRLLGTQKVARSARLSRVVQIRGQSQRAHYRDTFLKRADSGNTLRAVNRQLKVYESQIG
jgi:hypothetical protein